MTTHSMTALLDAQPLPAAPWEDCGPVPDYPAFDPADGDVQEQRDLWQMEHIDEIAALGPPLDLDPSCLPEEDLAPRVEAVLDEEGADQLLPQLVLNLAARALKSFRASRSVSVPLVAAEHGSPQEALAVLAGLEQFSCSVAALELQWQEEARRRLTADAPAEGVDQDDPDRTARHERDGETSLSTRLACQEIALARRTAPQEATLSVTAAQRLTQHLPRVHELLDDGVLTLAQARVIATSLHGRSPELLQAVDEQISRDPGVLDGAGRTSTRSIIERIVQEHDPRTTAERHERAARTRHVTFTRAADGMMRISGLLRGVDGAAMAATLQRGAESLRAGGASGPLSALEADLAVHAVLASGDPAHPLRGEARAREDSGSDDHAVPERPRAADSRAAASRTAGPSGDVLAAAERALLDARDVPSDVLAPDPDEPTLPVRFERAVPAISLGIVISPQDLLDPGGDGVAHLEGYGIIPASTVHRTLDNSPPGSGPGHDHPAEQIRATYRRLYTHPTTGQLAAMDSRSRIFPATLSAMIRWRDATCRAPWCEAPVRHIDHAVDHADGGATSYANGQGLCISCNLLKSRGGTIVTPSPPSPPSPRLSAPRPSAPSGWTWDTPHGTTGRSPTPRL